MNKIKDLIADKSFFTIYDPISDSLEESVHASIRYFVIRTLRTNFNAYLCVHSSILSFTCPTDYRNV